LILGPDRSPLSKRHGATAVSQYREEGFLPEALQNYLILLGWTPPSGRETLSFEEMSEAFSIEDVSKSAPIFNRKKLEWLNSFYIREKEEGQLAEILIPYLQNAGIRTEEIDRPWLRQVSGVLKENLVVLSQAEDYLGIFFDEKFFFEDGAKTLLQDPRHRETLQSVLAALETPSEVVFSGHASLLSQLEKETGRKGKSLYAPLRAAATGKIKGPELAKTLPLLGNERIIRRIKKALELS
jgi:nondiscriminating glutamyl-tRNA synthetase